jgi:hypothetical protein
MKPEELLDVVFGWGLIALAIGLMIAATIYF